MKKLAFFASCFALLVCAACNKSEEPTDSTTTTTGSSSAPNATTASFSTVQPILQAKCVQCHGEKEPKEGVQLTDAASVLKGGKEGTIVKAGDPAGSLIVQVMRGAEGHKKMPPMGEPVPEDDIKKVEAWIQAGAKPE